MVERGGGVMVEGKRSEGGVVVEKGRGVMGGWGVGGGGGQE